MNQAAAFASACRPSGAAFSGRVPPWPTWRRAPASRWPRPRRDGRGPCRTQTGPPWCSHPSHSSATSLLGPGEVEPVTTSGECEPSTAGWAAAATTAEEQPDLRLEDRFESGADSRRRAPAARRPAPGRPDVLQRLEPHAERARGHELPSEQVFHRCEQTIVFQSRREIDQRADRGGDRDADRASCDRHGRCGVPRCTTIRPGAAATAGAGTQSSIVSRSRARRSPRARPRSRGRSRHRRRPRVSPPSHAGWSDAGTPTSRYTFGSSAPRLRSSLVASIAARREPGLRRLRRG